MELYNVSRACCPDVMPVRHNPFLPVASCNHNRCHDSMPVMGGLSLPGAQLTKGGRAGRMCSSSLSGGNFVGGADPSPPERGGGATNHRPFSLKPAAAS